MKISAILADKGAFVATISPDSTVGELVTQLATHRIGALVVSADGRTIDGIVSERDVVRGLVENPSITGKSVRTIMTASVHTTSSEAAVDDLMVMMTERRVRHVPVVDDSGQLIGLVSIGDLVKTRIGELEGERAALMDYITRGG